MLIISLDDVRIVAEHYEGIKAHLDNTRSLVENKTGLLTFSRYGDWCAAAVPGQVGCSYTSSLVSTFYLILELDIVSQMATLLGYKTDSDMYSEEAGIYSIVCWCLCVCVCVCVYILVRTYVRTYVRMYVCMYVCMYVLYITCPIHNVLLLLFEAQRRKDFNEGFYNTTTQMYSDGKLSLQTAQALALEIEAVLLSNQASVLANLLNAVHQRKDHLDTGAVRRTVYIHSLFHGYTL